MSTLKLPKVKCLSYPPAPADVRYYPIQQRWRKLGPLYRSPAAALVWYPEMEAFMLGRSEDHGFQYKPTEYSPELRPSHYDSLDWRWSEGRRGPMPAFWDYVCSSACHWTAALNYWVARQVEPGSAWRFVTANTHTTIWDGEQTLFDGNFLALGIPAQEAWELAANQPDSEIYPLNCVMNHTPPRQIRKTLKALKAQLTA